MRDFFIFFVNLFSSCARETHIPRIRSPNLVVKGNMCDFFIVFVNLFS
jgi:hypothetical protein